jgi:hypothetical protein
VAFQLDRLAFHFVDKKTSRQEPAREQHSRFLAQLMQVVGAGKMSGLMQFIYEWYRSRRAGSVSGKRN